LPNEPRSSHILFFIGVSVAVSLVLCGPLLLVGGRTSSAFLQGLMPTLLTATPALSMMAAAVGAPPRRKMRYVLGLLAFMLAFDVIAFATGWQALVLGAIDINGARSGTLVIAYRMVMLSGPVVALVLLAGRRPSVFWTSA